MRKQLANIITSSRIAAGIVLFFFSSVTGLFLGIYVYCGVTDLIDGPIARKMNTSSNTGALLDTVGDVLTYLALVKILLVASLIPMWAIIWFVIGVLGILASGFVSRKRFGKFSIIHSLFGKLMGFFAFTLPFAVFSGIETICYIAICTSATISAFESNYIQMKLKEPDDSIISIPQLKNK